MATDLANNLSMMLNDPELVQLLYGVDLSLAMTAASAPGAADMTTAASQGTDLGAISHLLPEEAEALWGSSAAHQTANHEQLPDLDVEYDDSFPFNSPAASAVASSSASTFGSEWTVYSAEITQRQYTAPRLSASPAGKAQPRATTSSPTRGQPSQNPDSIRQNTRRQRAKVFVRGAAEATAEMNPLDTYMTLMGEQQEIWRSEYKGKNFGLDMYWHLQMNKPLWNKVEGFVDPDIIVKLDKKRRHIPLDGSQPESPKKKRTQPKSPKKKRTERR